MSEESFDFDRNEEGEQNDNLGLFIDGGDEDERDILNSLLDDAADGIEIVPNNNMPFDNMSQISDLGASQGTMSSGIKSNSDIWIYFDQDEINRKARCKHCAWNCTWYKAENGKAGTGTKSMWNHTKSPKSKYNNGWCGYFSPLLLSKFDSNSVATNEKSGTNNPKQTTLLQDANGFISSRNAMNGTLTDSKVRTAITEFLIMDELSFRHSNGAGFRALLRLLRPLYKPLSRQTHTRDLIYKLTPAYRAIIRAELIKESNRGTAFSFTTDIWTCGVQCKSYMALTIHYVDSYFEYRAHLLAFKHLTASHSGEYIASELLDIFELWGIQQSVFSIVLDNASNNTTALSQLKSKYQAKAYTMINGGSVLHGKCNAHIANIIAQNGLKVMKGSTSKLRVLIHHTKLPKQKVFWDIHVQQYDESHDSKLSGKAIPTKDVATRWNATNTMLKTSLPFKDIFAHWYTKTIDKQDPETGRMTKGRLPSIDDSEWRTMECIHKFLDPLETFTKLLSVTTAPSQHVVVSFIHDLDKMLSDARLDDVAQDAIDAVRMDDRVAQTAIAEEEPLEREEDTNEGLIDEDIALISRAATGMYTLYNKYYQNIPIAAQIALCMDPTMKLEYAAEVLQAQELDSMRRIVYDMYDRYYARLAFDDDGYPILSSNEIHSSATASSELCPPARIEVVDGAQVGGGSAAKFKKRRMESSMQSRGTNVRWEIETYLSDPLEVAGDNFDILHWWKGASAKYPRVALMARHFLGIPASSVASEQAFSTSGRVITDYRSCLDPETVEAIMLAHSWLNSELKNGWKLPHNFEY